MDTEKIGRKLDKIKLKFRTKSPFNEQEFETVENRANEPYKAQLIVTGSKSDLQEMIQLVQDFMGQNVKLNHRLAPLDEFETSGSMSDMATKINEIFRIAKGET